MQMGVLEIFRQKMESSDPLHFSRMWTIDRTEFRRQFCDAVLDFNPPSWSGSSSALMVAMLQAIDGDLSRMALSSNKVEHTCTHLLYQLRMPHTTPEEARTLAHALARWPSTPSHAQDALVRHVLGHPPMRHGVLESCPDFFREVFQDRPDYNALTCLAEGWTIDAVRSQESTEAVRAAFRALKTMGVKEIPNSKGECPLFVACLNGQPHRAEAFLAEHPGSSVDDLTTADGDGLLHRAIDSGRTDRLAPLIDAGCDPLRLDGKGRTALECAAQQPDSLSIMQLLTQRASYSDDHIRRALNASQESATRAFLQSIQALRTIQNVGMVTVKPL